MINTRATSCRTPVNDVVGIDITAAMGTAGKAAATIAVLQRPVQGRGDGAGLATQVQGIAVLVFAHVQDRSVTGQTSCGLMGNG